MNITVTLDTTQSADLGVLYAIVAALGGRLPEATRELAPGEMLQPVDFVPNVPVPAPVAAFEPLDTDTAAPVSPSDPNETDSRGRTWSETVHSGTRAKNADGSWRYKRGVDKALVEQFEATAPVVTVSPTPAVTAVTDPNPAAIPTPPVADVPAPAGTIPDAPAVPTPVVASMEGNGVPTATPAAIPTVASVTPSTSFAGVMKKMTASGKPTAEISELVKSLGVPGIADLMKPEYAEQLAQIDLMF